jgi:hypothetical protein
MSVNLYEAQSRLKAMTCFSRRIRFRSTPSSTTRKVRRTIIDGFKKLIRIPELVPLQLPC